MQTKTETTQSQAAAQTLQSINQFCASQPAFNQAGMRHLFFVRGHDLPGVYKFGRKILIDPAEFIAGVKSGSTAHISGGVK